LQKAKEKIDQALDLMNIEKIFQAEGTILRLLNLHNAKEMYIVQAKFAEKKIEEVMTLQAESIKGSPICICFSPP